MCLVWTLSAVHEPVTTRAAMRPATSSSLDASSIAASTCSHTFTDVSHVLVLPSVANEFCAHCAHCVESHEHDLPVASVAHTSGAALHPTHTRWRISFSSAYLVSWKDASSASVAYADGSGVPTAARAVTPADLTRTRPSPTAHDPSSVPRLRGPAEAARCAGLDARHATCTVRSHAPVGWSASIVGRSTAASTTSAYTVAGASMALNVFQCALRKYAPWKLLDPGAVTR
mmetsp:Transcript_13832/g.54849  ORF Transcript_13832/g.54849 Transcript_13832/m.54849 type:complete len:230 (+) Transcript_13832:1097-1786(+)